MSNISTQLKNLMLHFEIKNPREQACCPRGKKRVAAYATLRLLKGYHT